MSLDPNYVVGFTDGEGCFAITVSNHRGTPKHPVVQLLYEIELREDDEDILRQIQATFGCGKIYRLEYERYKKWRPHVKYVVRSFRDISGIIIPYFTQYPLRAKKRFQFQKFCAVAEMIRRKEHLTLEGIAKILEIRQKDSLDALDAHVQWGAIETN